MTKVDKNRKFLIKQGDLVQVIAGKDKGKTGKVLKIEKAKDRVFVEGINIQQKHQKPTQKGQKGSINKKEGPVHYSNILLYSDKSKKGERICIERDGKKLKRIFVSEKRKNINNVTAK